MPDRIEHGVDTLFSTFVALVCLIWFAFIVSIADTSPIKYFYSVGLIACLIATLKFRQATRLSSKDLWFILGLIGFYGLSRFLLWNSVDIWVDEYAQYEVFFDNKGSIISMAFKEQQPPLDYVTSALLAKFLPSSLISVKLSSLFWGGFFVVSLFLYLREKAISNWTALGISAFPLFITPLVRESLQARPLSLALVCAFFSIYYFFKYLRSARTQILFLFVSSTFIFLMATGLQPVVMIFCLFLISIPRLINRSVSVRDTFLAFGASALFSLPTLYLLVGGIQTTSHLGQSLGHLISYLKGSYLQALYRFVLEISLVLIFLLGLFFKGGKKKEASEVFYEAALCLLFLFLLPFVYCLFISYRFDYRYAFCFFAAFFFMLGNLVSLYEQSFKKALGTFIILVIFSFHFYAQRRENILPAFSHPGWRGIWQELEVISEKKDLLMALNLTTLGEWRAEHLVGALIFDEKIKAKVLSSSRYAPKHLGGSRIYMDKQYDYSSTKNSHLFVVVNKHRSRFGNEGLPFKESLVRDENHLVLYRFKINAGSSSAALLSRIYRELIENSSDKLAVASIYESAIALEAKFLSKERARNLLGEYRSLTLMAKRDFLLKDGRMIDQKAILKKNISLLSLYIEDSPLKR